MALPVRDIGGATFPPTTCPRLTHLGAARPVERIRRATSIVDRLLSPAALRRAISAVDDREEMPCVFLEMEW
ncbi:hypothetical protein WS48_23885 [Burkholderia sp. RF7-non_BP1]|nr:hypothetical protein WS45_10885 [Burkholderia sp. RF2-non_BP3]KUY72922.1 hypothetical protein WS46_03250 [Burkholderia sp. RF4-BP95]KUY92850.1 hypothetical protein WS48_23885 [Burkholderia sp. RF7-non_BP1]KUZ05577.1 hypothetical protein WS49_05945 [Burkholderia sp. RF7-non_BP4]